ncbi:uncharacterized protein LODBEIA_P37480 [Lodderomyces beijingensis]|uniref:Uncharacterized protein n=1 Tax=Lodderomyces beijingensis TaxID=1775926 RepID=A0ABP0ZN18_9ASCO
MIPSRSNGLVKPLESQTKESSAELPKKTESSKSKSWFSKETPQQPPPQLPTPKPFKTVGKPKPKDDKVPQKEAAKKRGSWWSRKKRESHSHQHHQSQSQQQSQQPPTSSVVSSLPKPLVSSNKSSMNLSLYRASAQQIPRSKSWWFGPKAKSAAIVTQSSGSSESAHHELISTESVDVGTSIVSVVKRLEEDDSIPIVYGNYSGEPTFKKQIEEPTIFQTQLAKFNNFDSFDEAAYFFWNIWEIDDSGKKKITRIMECKQDFLDFFKNFQYEKVFLMRSSLIPNYNSFKNGYLVKLKLLHGRTATNADLGWFLFMKCCKSAILNNVPNNEISISICGFTYTRKSSMTSITLWIHPIFNMSFDISNQVRSLIQHLNFGVNLDKITLIDINNNSKTLIETELT